MHSKKLFQHIFDHWKATLVDLKKFKANPFNNLKTDKEKWIYILNDAPSLKEEDREALKKDPIFQRAIERLEMLSSDPKKRKAYEASVDDQRDHTATIDAAKQEGRKERDYEIAQALLKQGLSVEKIAEATNLSVGAFEGGRIFEYPFFRRSGKMGDLNLCL